MLLLYEQLHCHQVERFYLEVALLGVNISPLASNSKNTMPKLLHPMAYLNHIVCPMVNKTAGGAE